MRIIIGLIQGVLYASAVALGVYLTKWNMAGMLLPAVVWVVFAFLLRFVSSRSAKPIEPDEEDQGRCAGTSRDGSQPLNPLVKCAFVSLMIVFAIISILIGHINPWALLVVPIELLAMVMWWLWSRHREDFFRLLSQPETLFLIPILGVASAAATSVLQWEKPLWELEREHWADVATIAAFVFVLAMMTFQSFHDRLENQEIVRKVRSLGKTHIDAVTRLVSSHVVETTLSELSWDSYINRIDAHLIRCYHATSHLFGFWLDQTGDERDKLSTVIPLLHENSELKVIGPSVYTFHYLIISRLFKSFRFNSADDEEAYRIADFIYETISKADATEPVLGEFFNRGDRNIAMGILQKILSEGQYSSDWWKLLSMTRWALNLTYYKRLLTSYQPYGLETSRAAVNIEFAERSCYDPHIHSILKGDDPIGAMATWQGRETEFRSGIDQIDRLFFPHCSFGILRSEGRLEQAPTPKEYLLSHDVLHTLNFNSLVTQSRALLVIQNKKLIEHHSEVFDSEWHAAATHRKNLADALNLWARERQRAESGVAFFSDFVSRMISQNYAPQ